MSQTIQVFEHDSLKVNSNGFTKKHLQMLEKFRGDKSDEVFPFYSLIHNGVKFKQYVGMLRVGNLQIEVLPKIDRTSQLEESKTNLLAMLKVVYKLKLSFTGTSQQKVVHSKSILDVFTQKFLDETETIMRHGLVKTYRQIEENCNALKGRLIISKQIQKNVMHPEHFYVRHSTYDHEHVLNQILYKTLKMISQTAVSTFTKDRASALLVEIPEVQDIQIDESLFSRLSFDRQTQEYSTAIELAKLLLLHYMPNLSSGNHNNVQALMFDMNRLWEEYAYICLKRRFKKHTIIAQSSRVFWHKDAGASYKTIRPDIVVKKSGKVVWVIDTKWKCPINDTPSDADLKQMYAYHQYWDSDKTVLLYPTSANKPRFVRGQFKTTTNCATDLKCWMAYIPIQALR